jgi:integrase
MRQRWDGSWESRVTLGYGPDGRQIRKSFYGATRTEVQQRLTRAMRELKEGLPAPDENQTVKKFLTHWLEDCHKPSVRHSTYVRSEQAIRLHIVPVIGHIKLTKLSPHQVQGLLTRKRDAGLAPRTVQIIHAVLRVALNQAVKWGDVNRNVAMLAKAPRTASKEIDSLNPDEVRTFLKAISGHRLEALFVLAITTGLRQGELMGLRWADVDLDEAQLRVTFTLQRFDGEYRLVEPKSRTSRRTVALPKTAILALRAHRTRQIQERMLVGPEWIDTGMVFTGLKGNYLNACVASQQFHKILKTAGLRHQRFHDLRHCCASMLVAAGVHPRVVMEVLGHSQISLTMNTYSHVIPDLKRETADKMDAILGA